MILVEETGLLVASAIATENPATITYSPFPAREYGIDYAR